MIASRVLDELKERLSAAYGERLHAVVLFGSEARGDARPDSDIDVLVVLETLTGDYGEELERGLAAREAVSEARALYEDGEAFGMPGCLCAGSPG
ncbi:MAG: nucleotidyltransferase domain-containing protein [Planctomycetaceae bacterium]|nr:nucleotidyltransferase domain-containing protein [Planctomycetaceae bacterium]